MGDGGDGCVDDVAVDLDRDAPVSLFVAATVLLGPLVNRPPAAGDAHPSCQRRVPVPAGYPQRVRPGVGPRGIDAGQVRCAGAEVGVNAGQVPEPVQLLGPPGHEPEDGGPAGRIGRRVVLDVVVERAAVNHAQRPGLRGRVVGCGRTLAHRLGRHDLLKGRLDRPGPRRPASPIHDAWRLQARVQREQPPQAA